MSLLGTTIGRIRLVDHLGKGGMGEVFVGYDQTLDRRVAVKCVRAGDQPDKIKGRFLQEARILSRLDHPNICQIYDFVESEDRDFLVMELVEGESLQQAAARGLDDKTKLRIAQDIANVLVAAHAEGVVHRDLKPEHVMITTEGEVKVLDFGVAHSVNVEEEVTLDLSGRVQTNVPEEGQRQPAYRTVAGSLVGTPSYMSPEQARGELVTPASDMYTFGLLLQELFTGDRPYPRQPMAALLTEVAEGRSRPVAGLGRTLSELIEELKALKPSLRPAAREAADRIRWIRDTPIRWLRRAAAATAILLLAMGVTKYTIDLKHERGAALAARDQAEVLVSFMLEDLSAELRPVGKLEVLEQVAHKALDYYEQAGPGAEDAAAFRRGTAFHIVAEVLDDQGDRGSAFEAASTGLEIHQRLVEANPGRHDWRNELALDHLRVGEILRLMGDDQQTQARHELETGFSIARQLVELEPDHIEWRQTLAEAHYDLGLFHLFHADDPEAARQSFEEAIAIYRWLADNEPTKLHFRFRLAALHGQGLGQTYKELGMTAKSFAAIEQAYTYYRELTFADPSNNKWQHGFAWENRRLGSHLMDQGRLPEALAHYNSAREISQRLLRLEPSNVDWQVGLAEDHSNIGALRERQGDPTVALVSFSAAVGILEPLVANDPADDSRHWLASIHAAIGSALGRLRRTSEATDAWQRVLELLAPETHSPLDTESWILEICTVALLRLERTEEARPLVERLRGRGWFEGSADDELVELCRDQGWMV